MKYLGSAIGFSLTGIKVIVFWMSHCLVFRGDSENQSRIKQVVLDERYLFVTSGDLNKDKKPDLIVTNNNATSLSVFMNVCI